MDEDNNNDNIEQPVSVWGENFAWEVIDALGQGVVILGADARFEYVNPAFAQMVGCSAESLVGLSPFDIAHPDDQEKLNQARQQRWSGGHSIYESRLLQPDGTVVYAHITGSPRWKGGEVVGSYAIITDLTAKKLSEKNLQESQSQLAGVVASAMDAIITIDEDQNIILFNAAAEQMFGCSAAKVMGKPLDRFIPEQFRAVHPQYIRRFGQAGVTNRKMGHLSTLSALRTDGEEFPIEASISQVEADGKTIYTVILRDVTERKRAEHELHESEERYRSALDNMLEGCQIIGFDWRYHYVNNAMAIQGKQTKEALLGQTMMEMYPGIERTEMFAALRRCMNERVAEQLETEFVFPDGSRGWFELSIQPVPEGIFILSFDLTEHKEAEIAVRQNETELQHVIDTVPEGVLLLTPDGSIRLTNPVADRFLQILAPELENNRITHLSRWPLNDVLTSPPKGLWHDIDAENHAFEVIARPVEVGPDNTGWVLVVRDVTQEREIQRRAQRQDRLAAVGQLAAGIAHDFNNIMAVIILYAQLILRTADMPARIQERLNTIEQQALRATQLIQQILDFSRQSVLERQPMDMLSFMKELVKLLKRTLPENIEIELTSGGEAYLIHADPAHIQQVMMNLAINARDAMPGGGQLKITLAQVQTKKPMQMSIRELPPGNWIQLQVVDSGSGISPQVMGQIFEPFFTTKEVGKGTGLGLAQVYGIVQQHDGYIGVTTKIGEGTTFSLYFPALNIEEASPFATDKASLQLGEGQMVLLVEDDAATRRALADSLVFMNYTVVEAGNGREALATLTARSDEIALVLSDTVMPEMGGIALLHAMQRQKLKIPVVLLTGHPLSRDMENLRPLGLAGWLQKPPNLANLSRLLAQALTA